MRDSTKKWAKFIIRWTIAIVGIGWVVWKTPLHDKVTILDSANRPAKVTVAKEVGEPFTSVDIIDPSTGSVRTVPRAALVNPPDRKTIVVRGRMGGESKRPLLAVDLSDDLKVARRFLIEDEKGQAVWVTPAEVVDFELGVPHPLVDRGILPMVRHARTGYLIAAISIFPLTFLITSLRWHLLLRAVGISIGFVRAAVINMVGFFYSTFLPGSTGGDLIKAIYAARMAPQLRTRAVMSVIIDRAIGMLGLVILGGSMAAYLALSPHKVGDAVAERCAQIAIGAAAMVSAVVLFLIVFYVPMLRRITGLDFLLRKLPMQEKVQKIIHTMELYRRRPLLVLATLVMTFPVHMTVIISAMMAGMAFGLPLTPGYYWVVVPVVVLVGAIPISPQGAGVMEFFAILLTRQQGCTVSQAFALTMSIRLIQMFWNLWGGIFVLIGGYHAPPQTEVDAVEHAPDDSSPTDHKLATGT
jgi:uncharacterized protein (TIRG00374 family)